LLDEINGTRTVITPHKRMTARESTLCGASKRAPKAPVTELRAYSLPLREDATA